MHGGCRQSGAKPVGDCAQPLLLENNTIMKKLESIMALIILYLH
jgi:hypothetical protein